MGWPLPPIWRGRLPATGLVLCLLLGQIPALAQQSEPARLAPQSLLIDADSAGAALVAVGERGHILRSEDDGQSWQQINAPTRALLTAVTFADDAHGWIVGQDATILHTTDGGVTWAQQFHTTKLPDDDAARDAPLLDISCISASLCAASGAYGLLLTTADGGQSWQRRYVKEDDRNFYAVHLFDTQHLLVAGEAGAVLESRDGGEEWAALNTGYDGSFFGFLSLPDNSWLLFGLRGHVLRSDDSGQSWQDIPTGVDSGLMGGRVMANGEIVLVGAGGVVLKSTDNAHSFTLLRQPGRSALANVIAPSRGPVLLLGEKGIQPLDGTP